MLFRSLNEGGSVEIGSTILNTGPGGLGGNITNILGGTVTSLGYNLSSDAGGGFLTSPADLINTDPKLGPLQDNGGPTFTQALSCESPAIDKGRNFTALATDQRGPSFARAFDYTQQTNAIGGDGTDIGAVEVQPGVCDSPVNQIRELIVLVQSFHLQSGTADSLVVKLQAAANALDRGNTQAACGNLRAFLNEVNALRSKKLTVAQADLLLGQATHIRVALSCP